MKLLCIADTHGQLPDDWFSGFKRYDPDLCIMLGDHSLGDAQKVLRYIPKKKVRAIYGNHDLPVAGRTYISRFGLKQLTYEEINGVRLLGVPGCVKYSAYEKPYQWTQEEYWEYMVEQPPCDVLITHCNSSLFTLKPGPAHQGAAAFAEYCHLNGVKYHIHGHNHISAVIDHGTIERCIYMAEMVEI